VHAVQQQRQERKEAEEEKETEVQVPEDLVVVVVVVVVDQLQGQILWGRLGLELFRGGRWLAAGTVQDKGEVTVGMKAGLNIGW
jgi:hypothetical protein